MHPQLKLLIECIDLEEKEQTERFRLDKQHTLKSLKAEGLALHPVIVTRKSFGYADYPEISFRLGFPPEANMFRDGASIECFIEGEDPIRGILLSLEGKSGEFRLFAPDYPDWIEDHGLGIKLTPDTRTTSIMKKVLNELENNKRLFRLFEKIHNPGRLANKQTVLTSTAIPFTNKKLNESQQNAVRTILENKELCIVHGPPGTGKTTTLTEAIFQLVNQGKKILVAAPSNTAVDNISTQLIRKNINLLRVGNTSKVDPLIFSHTPEGKLGAGKVQKEIKQLKIRAEEFRRMALKYKRSFGKAEREQRNLLFKEVRNIRTEIKQILHYNEEKLYNEAQVIAGTPIGLYDAGLDHQQFDSLVIDEAGQCIEPLAWCILHLAPRVVLAGDHWQLPPTVLSREAQSRGFNRSVLETAIPRTEDVCLLDIQYRMRPVIAGFSSQYFYDSLLKSASHLQDLGVHLSFIDTAGSGFEEKHGPDGVSLQNEGELKIVEQLITMENFDPSHTAVISPYSGQVTAARENLDPALRISTIDSFQGQEMENIIVSLVRSNEEGEIGFLKDYRRMNVAITRAKDQLIVIGDSATVGADPFFNSFLTYVEKHGNYRTVWEFEM